MKIRLKKILIFLSLNKQQILKLLKLEVFMTDEERGSLKELISELRNSIDNLMTMHFVKMLGRVSPNDDYETVLASSLVLLSIKDKISTCFKEDSFIEKTFEILKGKSNNEFDKIFIDNYEQLKESGILAIFTGQIAERLKEYIDNNKQANK